MMPQHTLNQLHQLRLDGMARALEEQWTLPASHSLSFDERLDLLLDRELAWRNNQRLVRLRKKAKLKYANACLEDFGCAATQAPALHPDLQFLAQSS